MSIILVPNVFVRVERNLVPGIRVYINVNKVNGHATPRTLYIARSHIRRVQRLNGASVCAWQGERDEGNIR